MKYLGNITHEGTMMTAAAATPPEVKTHVRPYCVFENGVLVAIIRTRSPERAIASHNEGRFEAIVADGDALYKAGKEGIEIRDAK